MSDQEHFRRLTNMYRSAPINKDYHPVLEIESGKAIVILTMHEGLHHAAGAVHGAIYFKAMDDAAFFAASSVEEENFLVTVSFTTYLTRPISSGKMIATGTVVHRSRRLILAEAVVTDEAGRQIARGNGSFMKSRQALSPEIGYR